MVQPFFEGNWNNPVWMFWAGVTLIGFGLVHYAFGTSYPPSVAWARIKTEWDKAYENKMGKCQ
jgi:hypothetical protein